MAQKGTSRQANPSKLRVRLCIRFFKDSFLFSLLVEDHCRGLASDQ
jgi:hypothetical protein